MLLIFITMLIILALAVIIIITASILSKKHLLDREKSSPFECGFDPFSSSRIPFSLRFFMITIIFLIFDVEIAILLPVPLISPAMNSTSWIILTSSLLMTLILGLIHEWNYGSLNWSN